MRTSVTALVVTSGETPYLAATLTAVARQSYKPQRVIVIDVSTSGVVHRSGTQVIPAPGAPNLGVALEIARKSTDFPTISVHEGRTTAADSGAQAKPASAIWILHDDSAPDSSCLEQQVGTLESGANIKVVGAKQRVWDKAAQLLEVGILATASGRRLQEMEAGEVDQGQYDDREDVLAVGTAAMLVDWATYLEVEGFDPALGPFGDGLEFCRRMHLAGHRVVVAPRAIVYHKMAGYYGLRGPDGGRPTRAALGADPADSKRLNPNPKRSFADRRQAQLHNWLVGAPWWQFLFIPLLVLILGMGRILWRIVTKEPLLAAGELRATLVTVFQPVSVWKSRARLRRHRTQATRTLQPFLIRSSRIWQARLLQSRVAKDRRRPVMLDGIAQQNYYTERNLDRAVVWSLALVLTAVATISWRFALTGVTGGGLANLPLDTGFFWHDLAAGWVNAGLGYGSVLGVADPLGVMLAILGQGAAWIGLSGPVVLTILLVLAAPLAWLCAWWAAGVLTDSRSLRTLAALSWALSPSLLASLGQGEISGWVLAVTIPLFAGALARATGMGMRRTVMGEGEPVHFTVYSARIINAGVASLAAFVAVAAAQVLVLPVVGLTLFALLKGAARRQYVQTANPSDEDFSEVIEGTLATRVVTRTRLKFTHLLIVLSPTAILVLPTLLRTITNPQLWPLWLSTLSVPHQQARPQWWDILTAWPMRLSGMELPLSVPGWQLLAYAPVILLLILTIIALLIPRGTTAVQWAALFALLGMALALLATNTPVALQGAQAIFAWSGPGLAVYHASLIAAATLLMAYLAPRTSGESLRWQNRGWQGFTVAAMVVPLLAASPMLANQVLSRENGFSSLRAYQIDSLPATVLQSQSGAGHQRALQLQVKTGQNQSTLVVANVWNNAGQSTLEASPWLKLKSLQLNTNQRSPDAGDTALSQTVAALLGGSTPNLTQALAQLNVKFLVVPPAVAGDDNTYATNALVNTLDATSGLERVTTTSAGTVWRLDETTAVSLGLVAPASWKGGKPSWPADAVAEKLDFVANVAKVPAGANGRLLALSWRADNGLTVRLNGQALPPVEGEQWNALYRLPANGGTLSVEYDYLPYQLWGVTLLVALFISITAALPLRRVTEVR